MLDTSLRPLVNRPLNAGGRWLARLGVRPDAVTLVGLATGVAAAAAIAFGQFGTGFGLIVLNRVLDGLDGAVARATHTSDRGGYLDIVVDYVFYATVPLGFALADPGANAVPAAALLAGFCLTATSFLAFATIAAKRGLETDAHGRKSFFYSTGLVEGSETIAFFLLMTAWPEYFPAFAWTFAALCVATTLQRTLLAVHRFDGPGDGQH